MKIEVDFENKNYFIDVEVEQFSDCYMGIHIYDKVCKMFLDKYEDIHDKQNYFFSCLEGINEFCNKCEETYKIEEPNDIFFYTIRNFGRFYYDENGMEIYPPVTDGEYNFDKAGYGIMNEAMSSLSIPAARKALIDVIISSAGNYFETKEEAAAFLEKLNAKVASLNNESVFDSKNRKFILDQRQLCEKHGYNYDELARNYGEAYYDLSQEEKDKISYFTISIINLNDTSYMHTLCMSDNDYIFTDINPYFVVLPARINELYDLDDPDYYLPGEAGMDTSHDAYFASREEAENACNEIYAFFMENLNQMMDKDKQLKEVYERLKALKK